MRKKPTRRAPCRRRSRRASMSRLSASRFSFPRADVESPLGRVRSLQLDASAHTGESRVADPAFKAVLLTPRESTGRRFNRSFLCMSSRAAHLTSTPADAPPTKGQAATVKAAPARPAKAPAHATASKPPASRPTFAAPKQAIGGQQPISRRRQAANAKPVGTEERRGFGRAKSRLPEPLPGSEVRPPKARQQPQIP